MPRGALKCSWAFVENTLWLYFLPRNKESPSISILTHDRLPLRSAGSQTARQSPLVGKVVGPAGRASSETWSWGLVLRPRAAHGQQWPHPIPLREIGAAPEPWPSFSKHGYTWPEAAFLIYRGWGLFSIQTAISNFTLGYFEIRKRNPVSLRSMFQSWEGNRIGILVIWWEITFPLEWNFLNFFRKHSYWF